MNDTDRKMLTELATIAANLLDVPRPQVTAPGDGATQEDHEAWFAAYKKNTAAYESLVRERAVRVEVALRQLAAKEFDEITVRSMTEMLAHYLAEPLPYPVAS